MKINMRLFSSGLLLLVVFLCSSAYSQTSEEARKNCSELPRVTYQVPVSPPPDHSGSAKAVVNILVDEKGRPREPKVVTSSGSKEFDEDAISTVKQWRFKAAVCDGKAAPVHILVELKSNLVK
jgi:TonB family protein